MASIIDNEWRPSDQQGVLEKHQRYLEPYKPNDVFWALGLEEEFYLESSQPTLLTAGHILRNQRAERYSVNYRTSFKEPVLDAALRAWVGPDDQKKIPIPLLVNGHAFSRTDSNGNAATTWSKVPKPNPKFSGKTVHEELCEGSLWLRENYNKAYCYDGNTIEIMTQNFYKTTAEAVCLELSTQRRLWASEALPLLNEMPAFRDRGPLRLQTKNHGLAAYSTNSVCDQVNLCNNGTLHVNLTMPTPLNEERWPSDPQKFREQHLQAIRLIQWFEPLLLAIYGEPDFLSEVSSAFSKASQRCAISRYISISNYDTLGGQVGKLLTTREIPSWYRLYNESSAYSPLEEIGFDIQFSKFPRHGIELRIFDRLPDSRILPLVRFLVLLLDRSLEIACSGKMAIKRPQTSDAWGAWVVEVLRNGKDAVAEAQIVALYEELLGCKLPNRPGDIYEVAAVHLEATYAETGFCSSRMLKPTVKVATLPVKKGIFCCG